MELIVLNIGLDLGVMSPGAVHDDGAHGTGDNDCDDAARRSARARPRALQSTGLTVSE